MKHCQRVVILGLSLFMVSSLFDPAEAANWPRFWGPNGSGTAADKDIPIQWNDKEGLLWKVPIPGLGNSSPIVWGDKVFVQSATEAERKLICFSTADGKILWTQSSTGIKAHTHPKNTLASSTPATDGERVYSLFWDGKDIALHAFDLTGKPVWKRDLGSFKSQHGVGASPVVYDGIVYLNNDQDGSAALIALDAKTGKDVFQVPRQAHRACYSTPYMVKENGTSELIVTSTAGITGYHPKNGTEIWHWNWTFDAMPLRTVGSSMYDHGVIYAIAGDGKGDRHAAAVKKGTKGDVTKTNLLWENKKNLPYVPGVLPLGDYIYFFSDTKGAIAGCAEAKTGKFLWHERLGGAGISSSPVLIDGKIYAADEKGDVYVILADPTYKLLAKNSLGEPVIATPAVADGKLYIRGRSSLFCIGKK